MKVKKSEKRHVKCQCSLAVMPTERQSLLHLQGDVACCAPVALSGETLDGNGLHGRAQAACYGHRAQQRPQQHALARGCRHDEPAA